MEDKTTLTAPQIKTALTALEGWSRDGKFLKKDFVFENFAEINDFLPYFAGAVAGLNHHPDFEFVGAEKRLSVEVTTHSEGGITQADLDLARLLNGWKTN